MAPMEITSQSAPPTAGMPPVGQAAPPPGQTSAPSAPTDQAVQGGTPRGAVPASGVQMPAAGDVAWAMLMEIRNTAGMSVSQAEQQRYQQIASGVTGAPAASGPAPASAPAGPAGAGGTGDVSWALLMEIRNTAGMGLSAAEQARYQQIAASVSPQQAPAGPAPGPAPGTASPMPYGGEMAPPGPAIMPSQPSVGPARTVPTDLGPAPAAPAAPMAQADYDREVRWAVEFERSPEARRYNAFKREHNIRTGRAEGTPSMNEQQYQTDLAWATQFQQSDVIQRYRVISAEVQRRQASGERTKPSGILSRVTGFLQGLWNRFTNRGQSAPAQAPAA